MTKTMQRENSNTLQFPKQPASVPSTDTPSKGISVQAPAQRQLAIYSDNKEPAVASAVVPRAAVETRPLPSGNKVMSGVAQRKINFTGIKNADSFADWTEKHKQQRVELVKYTGGSPFGNLLKQMHMNDKYTWHINIYETDIEDGKDYNADALYNYLESLNNKSISRLSIKELLPPSSMFHPVSVTTESQQQVPLRKHQKNLNFVDPESRGNIDTTELDTMSMFLDAVIDMLNVLTNKGIDEIYPIVARITGLQQEGELASFTGYLQKIIQRVATFIQSNETIVIYKITGDNMRSKVLGTTSVNSFDNGVRSDKGPDKLEKPWDDETFGSWKQWIDDNKTLDDPKIAIGASPIDQLHTFKDRFHTYIHELTHATAGTVDFEYRNDLSGTKWKILEQKPALHVANADSVAQIITFLLDKELSDKFNELFPPKQQDTEIKTKKKYNLDLL